MDSLQMRVPGSFVMLVVTHIDSVSQNELELMRGMVMKAVQEKLKMMMGTMREGVQILNVFKQGESMPVNCLAGDGVSKLREELVRFAVSTPWYRESLPASWVRTKQRVLTLAQQGHRFLGIDEFMDMARQEHVTEEMLPVATRFLHETGVIRYFGERWASTPAHQPESYRFALTKEMRKRIVDQIGGAARASYSSEDVTSELSQWPFVDLPDEELRELVARYLNLSMEGFNFGDMIVFLLEKILIKRKAGSSDNCLQQGSGSQETVYISPEFMINVMKGLIRHDHATLLEFFCRGDQRAMMRRVNRLSVWGLLHESLLCFLWPSSEASKEYWQSVCTLSEGALWETDVMQEAGDKDKVVGLLEGFDLMVFKEKEREYLVPALLKRSRIQISGDAFCAKECPFYYKFSYSTSLPPGAFESVVVRVARFTRSIDCSAIAAVFYRMGHVGQLLVSSESSERSLAAGSTYLTVRASSKQLLSLAKHEVERMEKHFPGLFRMGLDKELHEHREDALPETDALFSSKVRGFYRYINFERPVESAQVTEAVQVLILTDSEPYGEDLKSMIRDASGNWQHIDELSIGIQLPSKHNKYQADSRVVLVCMTPTIGECAQSCRQFDEHIRSERSVIPILSPGYTVADYQAWWPASMSALQDHRLFVDLRRATQSKVNQELLPQILKFLEEWRIKARSGSVLKGDASASPTSPTQGKTSLPWLESDVIHCIECFQNGIKPDADNTFSRTACRQKWYHFIDRRNMRSMSASEEESLEDRSEITLEPLVCPRCRSNNDIRDLLSVSNITEAAPCPLCLKNGSFSPGAFNIRECRLLLSEGDRNRMGVVKCDVCGESSRIMDVVPPEVFGSYNWGARQEGGLYSTQETVVRVMREVENRTDLVCWVDVEGGMGAGQDHFKEMLQGVTRANAVVVFLSDAYLNSANCKREFALAAQLCKYMIPVLIPDTGAEVGVGISAGWTGPGPEDPHWWQHAERACRDPRDPDDEGRNIDWSVLALYTPIDYEPVCGETEVLDELERRIMSRLHRATKLDMNTIISQKKLLSTLLWGRLVSKVSEDVKLRSIVWKGGNAADPGGGDAASGGDNAAADTAQEAMLKRMFELYDTDCSGSIDCIEVKAAMRAFGLDPSDQDMEAIIQGLDKDRSGAIDFPEFAAVLGPRLAINQKLKASLAAAFEVFDLSKVGRISAADVRRVADRFAGPLGRSISDEEVEWMIRAGDADRDGMVCKDEFVDLMCLSSVADFFHKTAPLAGQAGPASLRTRGAKSKVRSRAPPTQLFSVPPPIAADSAANPADPAAAAATITIADANDDGVQLLANLVSIRPGVGRMPTPKTAPAPPKNLVSVPPAAVAPAHTIDALGSLDAPLIIIESEPSSPTALASPLNEMPSSISPLLAATTVTVPAARPEPWSDAVGRAEPRAFIQVGGGGGDDEEVGKAAEVAAAPPGCLPQTCGACLVS